MGTSPLTANRLERSTCADQAEPDNYGDSKKLFDSKKTTFKLLPYEGSYAALRGRDVNLGRQPLIDALTIVVKVNVDVYQLKPPFVIVIEMMSEALDACDDIFSFFSCDPINKLLQ
ncbi:hypothetical protein Tsubulata_045200, partial [Turnera subulata]